MAISPCYFPSDTSPPPPKKCCLQWYSLSFSRGVRETLNEVLFYELLTSLSTHIRGSLFRCDDVIRKIYFCIIFIEIRSGQVKAHKCTYRDNLALHTMVFAILVFALLLSGSQVDAGVIHMDLTPLRRSMIRTETRGFSRRMSSVACKFGLPSGQSAIKDSQPFIDFFDDLYLGNITIGTPRKPRRPLWKVMSRFLAQTFMVVLDTGSSDLWVIDKSCTSAACAGYPSSGHRKQHFDKR